MLTATNDSSCLYIVDDDSDFGQSVDMLLRAWGWATSTFPTAESFAQCHASLPEGPVLLDLRMPGVGGLELLEAKAYDTRKFPTVVVTGHGDVDTAVRSLKAGAIDFLEKPFSGDELAQALERAIKPKEDSVTSKQSFQAIKLIARLTEREKSVLRGLLTGKPYKVIAHELQISPRTIEMHRDKLLKKLGVRTNGEAMRLAVLAGIDPAD